MFLNAAKRVFNNRGIFYVLIVFFCFNEHVSAYQQQFNLDNYSIDRGLPSYFVKDVEQDSLGFLWIATDNGLARYDGYQFKKIIDAKFSQYVKNVHLGKDGSLWILHDAGLSVLSGEQNRLGRFEFEHLLSSSKQYSDSILYQPREIFIQADTVWISQPSAIGRWTNGKFKNYPLPHKFMTNGYHTSFHLRQFDSTLLAFSETGFVLRYDQSRDAFIEINLLQPTSNFDIQSVLLFKKRLLVAGSSGIFEYVSRGKGLGQWRSVVSQANVTFIAPYKDQLGVLTENSGIFLYELSGILAEFKGRIGGNELRLTKRMMVDRDANVWVSTDRGLTGVFPQAIEPIYFPTQNDFTRTFKHIGEDSFLVASGSMVYQLTPKKSMNKPWNFEVLHQNLREIEILDVAGNSNDFWMGYSKNALARVKDGKYQAIDLPPGFGVVNPSLFEVEIDDDGHLWFIRDQEIGVWRLGSKGEPHYYGMDKGLESRCLNFEFDTMGNMYVGGVGAQSFLYKYDKQADRFENLSSEIDGFDLSAASTISVHDLDVSLDGTIHLATSAGIFTYSVENGFSLNEVFAPIEPSFIRSIAADNLGEVWVGTENGMYFGSPKGLFEYNVKQGLPGSTCQYRAIEIGVGGQVWVGTNEGIGRMVQVPNEAVPSASPLLFTQKGGQIESDVDFFYDEDVHVHAMTVSFPVETVRYQYRLLPKMKHWSAPQYESVINLSRPGIGRYRLEVRALKLGKGVGPATQISLYVIPKWYNSVLAFLAYFLILVGVLVFGYLLIRQRMKTKKVIRRLMHTEQRLDTLLANTPIFFFVTDQNGRFVFISGKRMDIFELDKEELMGKDFKWLFSDRFIVDQYERARKGRETTFTYSTNGRHFDMQVSPVFDDLNRVMNVIGIGIDITDRVGMEAELIKSKEMAESANRSKSAFLANMSHELRTPLNAILGFSQILNNDKSLSERPRHYINIMYKSGEHLLGMINDILDLSKIEAGYMEVRKTIVSIETMVADVMNMFKVRAEEKQLSLILHTDSSFSKHVNLDHNKLRQILINLIGNAVKFTENGKVTIELRSFKDEVMDLIELCISDTGTGMTPKEMETIFAPFQQGQRSNKEGTGLGLAITKRLVELMGGTIEVESTLNKGSLFRVVLPVEVVQKPEQESDETTKGHLKAIKQASSLNVLVVDDVEANMELLVAFFESLGVSCRRAYNGKEALDALKISRPDLIMMDIVMPLMDGKTALKQIRTQPEFSTIPVIAVTASGFDDAKQELLGLGFDEYIRKPFQQIELVDALKKCTSWDFVYDDPSPFQVQQQGDSLETKIQKMIPFLLDEDDATVQKIKNTVEIIDIMGLKELLPDLKKPELYAFLKDVCEDQNYKALMLIDEIINEN